MVKEVAFAVPGDLATPTGGYAYDRRIIAELRTLGWRVEVVSLGEDFPHPTPQVRSTAIMRLASLPPGRRIVVDGLALGVLPEAAVSLQRSHELVALVHHPLALETGLDAREAATLHASERAALACARRVITTSAATARVVAAEFAVPADRIAVVAPGTDRVAQKGRPSHEVVSLLSVGSVVPRKGYDVLIAALAQLVDLSWQLVIVGDRGRSLQTTARLDLAIARHQLTARVHFIGAVAPERLSDYYEAADLFVLPSRYEGYGMAFTEAVAHGLPVLGTTAGAIPDTVPPGAGVLVPPDDVASLAAALRRLIVDKTERARYAAHARAAAAGFPSWHEQGRLFASVLDALA